jgi:ParB family transcriptional regulator, chromosome partitioning protein
MSRRRALGRGLDALLGEEQAPLRTLPVDLLRPNHRQPRSRFDDAGLDELAESIRTQGVVQPIVVTPADDGAYTIVAGERRWRAARRAGLTAVPAVVRQVAGDRELLELALVENLQRSDLNPLEEAEAYRMLRDEFQLSQEEIGARVGKTRPTVANALRLLKLPAEVQDLLRDGRLSAGQARPLLGLAGEEEQVRVARRAAEEGLSARELERLVAAPPPPPRRRRQPPDADVHTAAAEEKLTQRLQTKVEIRRRRRGGEVRVHFHSEEELMRIYDHLMRKG